VTERKALRVTSPTNAWALGGLGMSFVGPVLAVTENYQPVAIESINAPLAELWQWALLVTAAIALIVTLLMRAAEGDGTSMRNILRVEGTATAVVAACYLLLGFALIREYAWGTAPITQLFTIGLGITATGRVLQIVWELRKYRKARRAGETATTEALAQPKET
jgi:hypothetical protein